MAIKDSLILAELFSNIGAIKNTHRKTGGYGIQLAAVPL